MSNLINCVACGKEISKSAKNCPHCGHPLKQGKSFFKSFLKLVVLFFLIIIVASFFIDKNDGQSNTKKIEYSKGDVIKTEEFEISIKKYYEKYALGNQFIKVVPSEGGKFVILEWSFKNISKKPIHALYLPEIYLVDPNGVTYNYNREATMMLESDLYVLSELNPGIKANTANAFEVSRSLFNTETWNILIKANGNEYTINFVQPIEKKAHKKTSPQVEKKVQKEMSPQVSDFQTITKLVVDNLNKYSGNYEWSIPVSESSILKNNVLGIYDFLTNDKKIAVAYTKPENYDCHSCAPILSFFILENKSNTWNILESYYNSIEYGSWGNPPKKEELSVISLGDGFIGLKSIYGDGGQGYSSEHLDFFLIEKNKKVKRVFSEQISSDDLGTAEPGRTLWNATVKFDKTTIPYSIKLHKKGKEFEKQLDEEIIYMFNGEKYEKVLKSN